MLNQLNFPAMSTLLTLSMTSCNDYDVYHDDVYDYDVYDYDVNDDDVCLL